MATLSARSSDRKLHRNGKLIHAAYQLQLNLQDHPEVVAVVPHAVANAQRCEGFRQDHR